MGKLKYMCSKCNVKHYPPTGKKCQYKVQDNELSNPTSVDKKKQCKKRHMSEAGGQNCLSNSYASPGEKCSTSNIGAESWNSSGSGDDSSEEETWVPVQDQILNELRKVNARLDTIEDGVAEASASGSSKDRKKAKLSNSSVGVKKYSSKPSKWLTSSSDSSSDELEVPNIKSLRTSRVIQEKVDQRLAKLEQQSNIQGNFASAKVKSKRGGNVDVYVEKKVAWPHEAILGGVSHQRITYDQLSLTPFVQGFSKNILDEPDKKIREKMVQYLSELMEDVIDFSWA